MKSLVKKKGVLNDSGGVARRLAQLLDRPLLPSEMALVPELVARCCGSRACGGVGGNDTDGDVDDDV